MEPKKIPLSTTVMLVLLAVIATFNITLYVSREYYDNALGNVTAQSEDYKKLDEIKTIIDKYFVGDFDQEYLIEGASAGLVAALGDKWSGYFDAESYKLMEESSSNRYTGVGITVGFDKDLQAYVVTDVAAGSSAQEAGIGPTDIIKAVGTMEVSGISQNELVSMVRGEINSTVDMTVVKQDGTEKVYTLTRKEVYTPDITTKLLDNIGYIRINAFDTGVEKEFDEALKTLTEKGAKGFIFDVRMNGGGYAHVMADMLDKLLPEGNIISMTSKDGKTDEERSDADCIKVPMAVLVNEYSISAAEFFAAAIQEYGVGTVIGEHTGGKGFAQTTIPLSDGSAVNISTYRYYTPKGNSLADVGVAPDIEVVMPDETLARFYTLKPEEDNQLQKAIEVLQPKLK